MQPGWGDNFELLKVRKIVLDFLSFGCDSIFIWVVGISKELGGGQFSRDATGILLMCSVTRRD